MLYNAAMRTVVLASGSQRRKEILELLGLAFEVAESLFDEDLIQTDDPVELVEELALQKALAVAKRYPDAIIIGGDTTVTFGTHSTGSGQTGWFGKAHTQDEARAIMRQLLGKTHKVLTGVAVVDSLTRESFVGSEEGIVTFRQVSDEELDRYVAVEKNWRGFAGAYALQGAAKPFVLNQKGTLSAIIGMPVELTCSLLEQAGVVVDIDPRAVEDTLHGMKVGL